MSATDAGGRRVAGGGLGALAALFAVLALAGPASAAPAEPRDYAYLFVQGRLTDPAGSRAVAGARVRLRGDSGEFETRTDRRGVFVFDKLPVDSYEVEVATADGKAIRGARQAVRFEPDRARIDVDTREGNRSRIRLETDGEQVDVVVHRPSTHWPKLWKELAVFLLAAGLFAL